VVQMNARAESVVRQKRGINLTRNGQLVLERSSETEDLHRLVAEAGNPHKIGPSSRRGLLKFSASGSSSPNLIFLFPIGPATLRPPLLYALQDAGRQILAVVHFRQDVVLPTAELVEVGFGLTPAESRVVMALVSGQRLADHAEQVGRSIHTVRLQIKSAMAKLGCRTQVELVRAVMQLSHGIDLRRASVTAEL
jgi:DNA-binding CsgD family transcriptional regulator